jgi:hypothetical protein
MDVSSSGRELPVRVRQAQGVVSVQADCGMDEALRRIAERAKRLGLTLDDTATDILGHRIWFKPNAPPESR